MNCLQIFLSLLLIWFNLSQGYVSTSTMTQHKKLSNSVGRPLPLKRMGNSPEKESRTFNFNSGGDDDESEDDGSSIKTKWGISSDNLAWGATSLVYWPPVLLVLGLLAIPTTLVILVVFIIPIITPEEDEKTKRSLNNGIGYGFSTWKPIASELAREIIFDSSKQEECIERISCELMTTVNSYTFPSAFAFAFGQEHSPLTNWIQKKISDSSVLSDRLKMRLSRSIQHSTNDSNKISCLKYICKPLEGNKSKPLESTESSNNNKNENENEQRIRKRKRRRRQRRQAAELPGYEPNDTLWVKIKKYIASRWIMMRKLEENKDVTFYPYLPSLGRILDTG